MSWWRRLAAWVRITLLEGRLQKQGYRRLHEMQVEEATERSKRVLHDLADAVIVLRTVAENVEQAIAEMSQEERDHD